MGYLEIDGDNCRPAAEEQILERAFLLLFFAVIWTRARTAISRVNILDKSDLQPDLIRTNGDQSNLPQMEIK